MIEATVAFHPIEVLMEKAQAIAVKENALAAVEQLVSILPIVEGKVSAEEFEQVRKAVGLAIGSIEMHVNVHLYRQFPDLET